MDRTEIEIALNRDRAWLIETFAALPEADVTRTPSACSRRPTARRARWSR